MKIVMSSIRETEFELKGDCLRNTNDHAAAWCFGARRHVPYHTDPELLQDYDALFFTMSKSRGDNEDRWLTLPRRWKELYPDKLLIFHQEAESQWIGRKSFEDQVDFVKTLQMVDIFLAHNECGVLHYAPFVLSGNVFNWPTIQDIDFIQRPPLHLETQKQHKRLGISSPTGRAGGIQGMAVASWLDVPVVIVPRMHVENTVINTFFDLFGIEDGDIIPQCSWGQWLHRLAANVYVYYHPMEAAAAGRDQIACAGLGIPVVGNRKLFSQQVLFPDLAVDVDDTETAFSLLDELYNDESFYDHCVRYADEHVREFHIDAGVRAAEAILEEVTW